ncbi:Hsp20/alpha crystallin family protein [bacterium]|nr:Hsp20/alpha crystallin family protein [bacterium]
MMKKKSDTQKEQLDFFNTIKTELRKLMNDILEPLHDELSQAAHFPYDMFVTKNNSLLIIQVEIPGIRKEDIHIESLDNFIEITGIKRSQTSFSTCLGLERSSGTFKTLIYLDRPVSLHKAQATLTDGLLEIQIPVIIEKRGKKIITII